MRIAFDHQIFGWQEYGGVSRYAYELATGLAGACGQDVNIICPLYVNRYLAESDAVGLVTGVRVPVFPKSGRIYRAVNAVLGWPGMRRFRPDIVHETYYSTRTAAPKGSKVVLTVYDMIHERFPENFSIADPTRREKAAAVLRADHVICISEQTRKDLVEFLGVPPEKTSVVHLGFTLRPQGSQPSQDEASDRPYLLYVGNRSGYKNFDGLVRAYASSPFLQAEFDLVCFGGGEFNARERDAVEKLGAAASRVRQVAGDDSVLASYYRQARAFVYPSRYEGFGIPPLEAMSFGCPVACSNVSSIPEVVGDAAEMFDPSDTESMCAAIERVASDEARRAELIARGRARLDVFSWQRCAQQTLDIYRRIAA
ncbi:glycosyltransferase family 4 protein [Aromatoleum petrolei]|uniref:Glycosyltransferase n=1 Tax=Aromatoleum petrolei TaxID=76116 RepID=A0ABX1MS76_9RHOO|nr:glycosyltransferase family 1 protein [Aromatoleum petrolei]NMF90633.1 glycosyltransferase [Aromatoleum petrolei]QTQ35905.1 Glycosyl transferase, family 1 [Aromatoleum petrolei]